MGAEFKTIACAYSHVMIALEQVEVHPSGAIPKMAALQLRLTEAAGIWGGSPSLGRRKCVHIRQSTEAVGRRQNPSDLRRQKEKSGWPVKVPGDRLSSLC
jgi:hypothetical protein